jgi:hypothetical protein
MSNYNVFLSCLRFVHAWVNLIFAGFSVHVGKSGKHSIEYLRAKNLENKTPAMAPE